MTHWIQRVLSQAGHAPPIGFALSPTQEPGEVWKAAAAAYGMDRATLRDVVASAFRTPVADLTLAEPTAVKLLPGSVAQEFLVFPLRDQHQSLVVATANPADMEAEQAIGFAAGRSPVFEVADPDEIRDAIDAAYSPNRTVETLLGRIGAGMEEVRTLAESDEPTVSEDDLGSGPVSRLASMILGEAISGGASDVHIQPTASGGVVRYRVDGVLRPGLQMPIAVLTRVVSRIKVMGRMDIADRLRPQDGRAEVVFAGQRYDLRISTVPTRKAEKAVIRILDPNVAVSLDETGLPEAEAAALRRLLSAREGIIVVTGPTGSGKTTTMYASLKEILTEDTNIMTVEDPVEYELSGLTQIQVEPRQGVTFASALRAIMRQDPDIIFVGEIRDGETAEIAVQASLTGHLVLATLHTNDAVGAIRRLSDLGVGHPEIADTLRGALAQRLVRRLCDSCSVAVGPDDELGEHEARLAASMGVRPTRRAVGCTACGGSGYRGRLPVVEVLTSSPAIRALIQREAPSQDIKDTAVEEGMRSLGENGLDMVRSGVTDLQELERILGEASAESDSTEPEGVDDPDSSDGPEAATTPGDEDSGDAAARVLVVDDDTTNRMMTKALLEANDFRVMEAADGGQALEYFSRGEHFDLMVLDLDMPVLGGREVLAKVRAELVTAGLPIIVLTGTADPDSEIEVLEAGADDYIRKPLDPPRFMTRIRATLRRTRG